MALVPHFELFLSVNPKHSLSRIIYVYSTSIQTTTKKHFKNNLLNGFMSRYNIKCICVYTAHFKSYIIFLMIEYETIILYHPRVST